MNLDAAWQSLPHAPPVGTPLGKLDDIADGGIRLFAFGPPGKAADGHANDAFRLLLLRSGSTLRAYVNRCAHFGVPLSIRPEHLIAEAHVSLTCNLHYALYRWQDGQCLDGECAGGALMPVAIAIAADGGISIAG